ncbi:MAG TPA: hypothetical protein VF167_05875 [Longimicrobiaceae bacterium]
MKPNRTSTFGILGILVAGGLAACRPDDSGPTEEQLRARRLAASEACAAERLLQQAEDELATLESLGVTAGPVAFQRAFVQHARLRLAALAQLDSALNHARSPTDSARYHDAFKRIQIRAPDPESVEANVFRSYESKAAAILADADHPCNWQPELEASR